MILVPVLIVLALCWPSVVRLHELWTGGYESALTHGYLIALVCLFLLWRNTRAVPVSAWRPDLRALIPFGALGTVWMFFMLAGAAAPGILLLPPLLLAAIWTCCGAAVARRALFPVAYLWFATPLLLVLTSPLQALTIEVVELLLRLGGVPALIDGHIVRVPSGTFAIEHGCSGIHFFVVALALGALMGELRNDPPRRRIYLLALAALLALLTNWVRVFVVIVVGHVTHMQHYLITSSHLGFGWFLFAIAMVAFLVLERYVPTTTGRSEPAIEPVPHANARQWLRGVGALAILALAIAAWYALSNRASEAELQEVAGPAGWTRDDAATTDWQPIFAGADAARTEVWRNADSHPVERYVALYRRQEQGKEFSAYGNEPLGKPEPGEWRFAQRYQVAERSFSSPAAAQLFYAAQALLKLRAPKSEVQVVRSKCEPDCGAAERRLAEWSPP